MIGQAGQQDVVLLVELALESHRLIGGAAAAVFTKQQRASRPCPSEYHNVLLRWLSRRACVFAYLYTLKL